MEPRDRPFDLVDGGDCAACGAPVPSRDVRLLARREDLAFAELPCSACGSVSLAIFVGSDPASAERPSAPDRPSIGPDDVLDMHLLLEAWTGDLRTLLGSRSDGAPGA